MRLIQTMMSLFICCLCRCQFRMLMHQCAIVTCRLDERTVASKVSTVTGRAKENPNRTSKAPAQPPGESKVQLVGTAEAELYVSITTSQNVQMLPLVVHAGRAAMYASRQTVSKHTHFARLTKMKCRRPCKARTDLKLVCNLSNCMTQ